MGPVLLLDVCPVVLVARPGPGEGDLVGDAVIEKVGVDELRAVVGVDPPDREGEAPCRVSIAAVPDRRLVGTERFTVQPVAMSVIVTVKQNSPKEFPPSWPARSISITPGVPSSHFDQVRIGI